MNVGSSIARGAAWMVAFKLLERGIGLISTLILARVLLPADFGTLAMATTFIGLLELLTAFSFDVALIQKQSANRDAYDTAWTFNCMLGLSVSVMMLALAAPVAAFYQRPELFLMICVLALGSAVQGFENIGIVAFRKELRFDREFRFQLAKKLSMFFTTVPLAFILRNYWALVAGIVVGRVTGVALSYYVHPFRPRFSLRARAELLDFSKWLVGMNLLGFLKERSADFFIGRMQGAHALGVFSIAYEIANMPATELVAPINRAVFPVYATIAGDRRRLATEYLSVMAMIVLLAVPAVAGIAATSSLIVPTVLGPNWADAAPVLALLAFFGITQVMQSNAYAVYLAVARADIQVKLTIVHVVVLITLLLTLIPWKGLLGAAMAFLVTALLVLPLSFALILRLLKIPALRFAQQLWRPMLASTIMYFAVHEFVRMNPAREGAIAVTIVNLLLSIALGFVTYVAVTGLLWTLCGRVDGAEAALLRKIASRLRPRAVERPS